MEEEPLIFHHLNTPWLHSVEAPGKNFLKKYPQVIKKKKK